MQTGKNQDVTQQERTAVLEKIKKDLFMGQYEPSKISSLRQRSENIRI